MRKLVFKKLISCILLSSLHFDSQGQEASFWMDLAKKGSAEAQYRLGNIYKDGEGVPQNFDTALKWFWLSADQQYVYAQISLGRMYKLGKGVPIDGGIALILFRLAAEKGNADAQSLLGSLYQFGPNIKQDLVRSLMWFIVSNNQNGKG